MKQQRRPNKKISGIKINIHFAFLAAAALIIAIGVIAAIRWNIGEASDYDPAEDTSQYDTEPLDYIQPLDPALAEGHEYDEETTMLCLGNGPFSDERGKDGLAQMLASKLEATVYDGAFAGSFLSMKGTPYSSTYPADGISLYEVTKAFCGGNYSNMESAILAMGNEEDAVNTMKTIKSIDFDKVDIITIMYDISDYIDFRPVMDPNDSGNLVTWNGSLNSSIQLIQKTFPHIRIIVMSHGFGYATVAGNRINGDTFDLGNGTLTNYLLNEIDVAMANGVSIIDNYYGTLTESRSDKYLENDYHLTKAARAAIADRFASLVR